MSRYDDEFPHDFVAGFYKKCNSGELVCWCVEDVVVNFVWPKWLCGPNRPFSSFKAH